MSGQGRVHKRVSGIEAEVQVTAARGIAVARGCTSTTAYGPDTAFRRGPTVVKFGRRPLAAVHMHRVLARKPTLQQLGRTQPSALVPLKRDLIGRAIV